METYVSFFRYAPAAWDRMVAEPGDRGEAASRLIEAMGGHMRGFWWMFGEWDGLCVYQVPETVTAAAMTAAMLTSRVLAGVQTHRLIDAGEARAALERAHDAQQAIVPPGGSAWYADYDALGAAPGA